MLCLSNEVVPLPSLADPSPQVVTGGTLGRKNCPCKGSEPSPPMGWNNGVHRQSLPAQAMPRVESQHAFYFRVGGQVPV